MTPKDAIHTIDELLFNLWYTDTDKQNCNGCIIEAIDKLRKIVEQIEDIEDILHTNQ